MSMRVDRVSKVIIGGNWVNLRVGTLQIMEMSFTDEHGNQVHDEPTNLLAYTFFTENGDEYYGPLSEIQLFKLVEK